MSNAFNRSIKIDIDSFCRLTSTGTPTLKIRRSRDRLIFNMGIPIPGRAGFYIETRLARGVAWYVLMLRPSSTFLLQTFSTVIFALGVFTFLNFEVEARASLPPPSYAPACHPCCEMGFRYATHYNDVTMSAMKSQITSVSIVYSNVY